MTKFEAILARHGVRNVDVEALESFLADHFGRQALRAQMAEHRMSTLDAVNLQHLGQISITGLTMGITPKVLDTLSQIIGNMTKANSIEAALEVVDKILDECR